MVRLEYDKDKFNSEPDVTLKIQGAKIYNPVTAAKIIQRSYLD